MPRKPIEELLNGKAKFGFLTFIRETDGVYTKGNGTQRYAIFKCQCGVEKSFNIQNVKSGKSTSCGCVRDAAASLARTKHGHSRSRKTGKIKPEYRIWAHIVGRCENPADASFHNYGGRGITVCAAWRESYEDFYKYMGDRPSPKHEIDRINNDGNYEPGNCRWVLKEIQSRNRRNNHPVTAFGETLCLDDMAKKHGINRSTLFFRLERGIEAETAILTPTSKD